MNNKIVTEGFTQALFFSGSVSIPQYLLDHYHQLGIEPEEMMLIVHLMAEMSNSADQSRILRNISTKMNISSQDLHHLIKKLEDKKLCSFDKNNPIVSQAAVNFGGLIDQLFEIWGIDQFKQIEASEVKDLDTNSHASLEKVTKIFEQELGRPLTAFECEHIEKWIIASSFSVDLIIEALRRGVSAGIRNFRYLDSILREWEKKGIKTKMEVEAEDQSFYERQQKKEKEPKRTSKKKDDKKDKYNNIYL